MSHYVSNIPAEEEKTSNNARFSCPICLKKWQKRLETPTPKGSKTFVYCIRLLWGIPSMLARKNRISTREFPSFKKKGIRFFSPLFSLTVYPGTVGVRASVVVSKKTAKTAVSRNRVRRQFYAILEQLIKGSNRTALLVFYPKTEALKSPNNLLKKEIENTLYETKLLV